jgi:glycosyltransferase involved in cell wall biosynthesis
VDKPVTWYHIGDENLDNIKDATIAEYKIQKAKLAQSGHVNYIPLGKLSSDQVFDFYLKTPVSLFISVSAAEGLPVSIMEALSFGIPVLATDVGGCNELVNENTGLLIPADSSAREIAKSISDLIGIEKNHGDYRAGIKAFWKKNFDSKSNYSRFINTMTKKIES